MLSLCSCFSLRYNALSHPRPHFIKSLPFSLFFPSKPPSHKPITIIFSPNPNLLMSSRPSAFDALMSGARAAAAKKKPQVSSSPKKRKTPDASNPSPKAIVPKTPDLKPPVESVSNNASEDDHEKCVNLEMSEKNQDLEEIKLDQGNVGKRICAVSVKERTEKLKSNILELKKKSKDFNPKSVACWDDGERVPFLFLCLGFDLISEESGRIVITDIVCNMLRTVMCTTPDDLVSVVYILANKIAPSHEGLELGIGDASIIKALAEAFGRTEVQVKKQYKELGDLGLVAKASRSAQSMMRKPDALTVSKVFDTFRLIAKESGKDSQEKKKNHMKSLLVAATNCEPLYLIRLLQTKLRIGLAEQTLLAALGQAAVHAEKHSTPPPQIQSPLEEAAKIVKQVYSVLPVYDKIVPALLSDGVWNLPKTCSFTPGVPVGPMLAKPTKGVSEILDKFQDMEFTCEYKYDGERAQDGLVEIYSRNAERNTGKFPDVVIAASRMLNAASSEAKPSVRSFILDCELVAYDRQKQKILPFQIPSTRARKNVVLNDIKVDVCIFAFDLLYLNGQGLIQQELKVRREQLYDSFVEESGYFQFATAVTTNDIEEMQKFLDAAVNSSCEGLIVKTLDRDATYEPSKRSLNRLKLKKGYIDNIGDSLDLIPIAAFHRRGKHTTGTGFSEAMLEERTFC